MYIQHTTKLLSENFSVMFLQRQLPGYSQKYSFVETHKHKFPSLWKPLWALLHQRSWYSQVTPFRNPLCPIFYHNLSHQRAASPHTGPICQNEIWSTPEWYVISFQSSNAPRETLSLFLQWSECPAAVWARFYRRNQNLKMEQTRNLLVSTSKVHMSHSLKRCFASKDSKMTHNIKISALFYAGNHFARAGVRCVQMILI